MNFFQAQDEARRRTGRLAILFAAAVISLVVLTNLLVAGVYVWTGNYAMPQEMDLVSLLGQLPIESWFFISTGVIGMILVACGYKYLMIRGGGRTIAESLGGQLLTHSTADGNAKRLLNIVEEMAIASGVSVPPVYLIPEPSINAFAAGFRPEDAVMGINQGTIDRLDRDELQGVVAHEFSHILNGDMQINLRLIAILHGILFLGMIGYGVLRGASLGAGRRSDSGGMPLLALGIGLLVIGYAGTFFGNLIKAAVSRQREYLADASAVQFTRNPSGIADALKKIGGLSAGSTIKAAAAAEASHMFFGQVQKLFLNSLMSTHPPLDERIRAIEPNWRGEFADVDDYHAQPEAVSALTSGFAGSAQVRVRVDPQGLVDQVGQLTDAGLDNAHLLIETTDDILRDAAHDPWGSRALIYSMLLDENSSQRDGQFSILLAQAERGVPEYTQKILPLVRELDAPHKLTLVEIAMPALKTLSRQQYRRFMTNILELIKHDRQINLMEWVLHTLLNKELTPHFEGVQRTRTKHRSLRSVAPHASTLISTLARFGHGQDPQERLHAFQAGAAAFGLVIEFDDQADPNFSRLTDAIRHLRTLPPLLKPKIIKACAATALADEHISGQEGALLQGIAAALDCPLPPSIYSGS